MALFEYEYFNARTEFVVFSKPKFLRSKNIMIGERNEVCSYVEIWVCVEIYHLLQHFRSSRTIRNSAQGTESIFVISCPSKSGGFSLDLEARNEITAYEKY